MNFTELVDYRNKKQKVLELLRLTDDIDYKISIVSLLSANNEKYIAHIDHISTRYKQMIELNSSIVSEIEEFIVDINHDIDQLAQEMFSTDQYNETWKDQNVIIPPTWSEDDEKLISSKITKYAVWQYPCLLINPRSLTWINYMVSGDPLYLTSNDIQSVKDLISSYPELYQRRLRLYETSDQSFNNLPQSQFGFVLCWDNFTFINRELLKKYLVSVYDLLAPGGVFMFNYTNCDLESVAGHAESHICAYNAKRLITNDILEAGYELINSEDIKTDNPIRTYISWLEIKKPGDLKTIKLSQAMAEIIEK